MKKYKIFSIILLVIFCISFIIQNLVIASRNYLMRWLLILSLSIALISFFILLFFLPKGFTYYNKNNKFLLLANNQEEFKRKLSLNLNILGLIKYKEFDKYTIYIKENKKIFFFIDIKDSSEVESIWRQCEKMLINEIEENNYVFANNKGKIIIIYEQENSEDTKKLFAIGSYIKTSFIVLNFSKKNAFMESSPFACDWQSRIMIKKIVKDIIEFNN